MTTLTELQRLTEGAAGYIGECRAWTPNYPGARPIECTVFSCGVHASFTAKGMSASIPLIWTHHMDSGREGTVWFTPDVWKSMPLVRTALDAIRNDTEKP